MRIYRLSTTSYCTLVSQNSALRLSIPCLRLLHSLPPATMEVTASSPAGDDTDSGETVGAIETCKNDDVSTSKRSRKRSSTAIISRHLGLSPPPAHTHDGNSPLPGSEDEPLSSDRLKQEISETELPSNLRKPDSSSTSDRDSDREYIDTCTVKNAPSLEESVENNRDLRPDFPCKMEDDSCELERYSLPTSFGKGKPSITRKEAKSSNLKHTGTSFRPKKCCEYASIVEPFDICLSEAEYMVTRKAALDAKIEGDEDEVDWIYDGRPRSVLRPGMVLLQRYITRDEQIGIVKKCRDLGLGPEGFYQPGYNDGAKLRLQMMCLGLDWDPQTRKYAKQRHVDGAETPDIPYEFACIVNSAMKDSHAFLGEYCGVGNPEYVLPRMTPDVCIVNFYTTSGRLGLHKDRDESEDSLKKGLPVVSASLGDSAEFLYGDQRDRNKAEKVVLESGDVLIFGGESRHIFHGVSSIIPNTTPRFLLQHTHLRPGRLNLTFRQY